MEDTQRPPGTFPRKITHREEVEYRYNPASGEFTASVVESTEPVVTGWDKDAPRSDERAVGTWDVTPTEDGIYAEDQGRASVPQGVRAQLIEMAEDDGEPVSTRMTINYEHDLDTGDTQTVEPTTAPTSAELVERLASERRSVKTGEMVPRDKYAELIEQMARDKKPTPPPKRRSASRKQPDHLNEPDFKLPEVIITQAPATAGRGRGF